MATTTVDTSTAQQNVSEERKAEQTAAQEQLMMNILQSFVKTLDATGPLLESLTHKFDAETTCATNKCGVNSDNAGAQSCPQNLGNIDTMCKSVDKALANTKISEEWGEDKRTKVQKQIDWLNSVQQACKMMGSTDNSKTDFYPNPIKPNQYINNPSDSTPVDIAVGSTGMSTDVSSKPPSDGSVTTPETNLGNPLTIDNAPPTDKPAGGYDGRIPQDVLDLARNRSCCGNKVTYIFA